MRTLCLLLSLLCLTLSATAQVEVSSLLDGYYRPGRFTPLRVRSAAAGTLAIEPEGSVRTQLTLPGGQVDLVVPILPMQMLRQVRYRNGDSGGFVEAEWKALTSDQKLVGFAGPVDLPLARAIFPDATIVPLRLSGPSRLGGAPAAWNTLDAVVFDGASLDEPRASALLASGISIAVRSGARPPGRLDWTKEADGWIARADLLGPLLAGENQPALAPVQGWAADWPRPFRYRILLYAGLFIVLAIGAALLPRRWAVAAIVVLSAVASSLLIAWARQTPVVLRKSATVIVQNSLRQADHWTWFAASNPGSAACPFGQVTLPMFQGRYWDLVDLTLRCNAQGIPVSYSFAMRPGVKVAFVSRECSRAFDGTLHALEPLDPLRRLGDRAYLQPGWAIAGAAGADRTTLYEEDWGTLVIRREK